MDHIPSSTISRVRQAHDEVGVTAVRPRVARWFVLVWLAMLFVVPVVDHLAKWDREPLPLRSPAIVHDLPEAVEKIRLQGWSVDSWLAGNRFLLQRIHQTEEDIEEQGTVAAWLRPWAQRGLLAVGTGNEQVYLGRDAWLFYRPDVDFVTGPAFLEADRLQQQRQGTREWEEEIQPDPLRAIIDFQQRLAARGISLLVVPVPVKPEIMPGLFSARFQPGESVSNRSTAIFLERLRRQGVWVVDVAQWLQEYQAVERKEPYLRTDTHWTPAAMQWVARRLAMELRNQSPSGGKGLIEYTGIRKSVTNHGDISGMLDLPVGWNPYGAETVTIEQVMQPDATLWKADAAAEILVLGDSFSNIYSLAAMGWGESAGWIEQVSLFLGQPVDRIVRNDQGAFATRKLLSRELARGRDRLAGKKMVIYQFAARELAIGDWQVLPLESGQAGPSAFLSLQGEGKLQVRGMVREVSPVPRPGSVPYRDHLVSIHLVDITVGEKPEHSSQAVVFLQSMKDNVWTPAARLRPGDEIILTLQNWADVAKELGGLNRSELDNLELQLQEPLWGELDGQ